MAYFKWTFPTGLYRIIEMIVNIYSKDDRNKVREYDPIYRFFLFELFSVQRRTIPAIFL